MHASRTAAVLGDSFPEAAGAPVAVMLSNILCYCSDDATAGLLAGLLRGPPRCSSTSVAPNSAWPHFWTAAASR